MRPVPFALRLPRMAATYPRISARNCSRGMKRSTSNASASTPTRVGPWNWWKLLMSFPNAAPESIPASTSTMNARPYPFGPPIGSRVPLSAASGSSVGSPTESSAPPSGILSPCRCALRILPRATTLDDMSRATGSGPGTAIEIGFVPSSASAPPQGDMAALAFPMQTPANPCAAACSV